jgi:hypothetical protein
MPWLSSYLAAGRPLWKRRHHFALPFSNFLQTTISAEAMAFLFSSASSVEASAFCLAFSNFLQMTISTEAMAFSFSSASSVEASAFCLAFSNLLQMTILAEAMAFFLFSSASFGVAALAFPPPCISADLTGDLLVVAFP